jgi:sugar phosphate isomerase/epimerase
MTKDEKGRAMPGNFTLSAFGDEIADDLETQLSVLADLDVRGLELRGAWGKNVLDLTEDGLARARALLDSYQCSVSAVGSPVGKSRLSQPREYEQERMQRAIRAAKALGTDKIRVFSFYYDGPAEQARDEVIARMALLTEQAAQAGLTLVHENEKDIYGDIPERCQDILASVGSPALRMAFDPANFVQCDVRPIERAWPLLVDYVTHIHIKDAVFETGAVRPAGQGDGAIPELLATLNSRGYEGYLTLEPHLKVAGHSSGYSGADGMRTAVEALRGLLEAVE